ncbi:hypothetical protein Tco_1370889 [Tanacetum coccineum]
MCDTKDCGPSRGLYLFRIALSGDSGPDLSFDKSASLERLFSLAHIKPTVTLFRVFQTLCKQGDWFSFTKHRAPSLVCIDDNCSCMKHWKSGFFFINRQAILDAMVWRHLNAAIDDPRPSTGSFNMADVRHLSAHVIKLRDMPEGVLVLSGLSRVWKSRVCDLVLRGADGNVMGIHDFLCLPEWTGTEVQEEPHLDDLAVGTPSSKIVAKAEASQKRKSSTSGATLSHVAKRTRSALAQSSGSTTSPSLFVGDDDESDDDDACVEIPFVTPLHSRGKGVMVDDVATPSASTSRSRPSSGPAPSFRNVFGDAIHTDFFPFSASPYYATYPVDGVAGNWEMVRVKSLFDDQLTAKMSVLHCLMMSHGGELIARYRRLNQSHYEYVLLINSRLNGYEEKVASLTGLKLQISALKKQVFGLNDKLSSPIASFTKSKAKGKERKKKIKSLTKSVDNLHSEVARLSAALNQAIVLEAEKDEEILRLKTTPLEFSSFFHGQFQDLVRKFLASDGFSRVQGKLFPLAASVGFERGLSMHQTKDEFATVLKKMSNFMSALVAQTNYAFLKKISKHATEPLSVILQLEPKKLVRSANIPASKEVRVSHPTKESTVTPASKSLELSTNVNFTASAIAFEHNEEMLNAEVDRSDPKMTDDTAIVKFGHAFVQGDGLDPSSATGEEATANPSRV